MTLPFEVLSTHAREAGLVVGALLGFSFGFVLERAGFGRATKLAAQFYLYDMTVFKVMFGAIVTAMLGLLVAAGLGVVDLAALSAGAASETFVWPMLVGGLMLGAGFIISGYCPGTSMVAAASGNLDGVATIVGVGIGSLVFAEVFPWVESFHVSGAKGHYFLYEWLGVSPAWVALGITIVAVGAFVGAERVERIMTKRISVAAEEVDETVRSARAPRRFAFGWYAVVAAVVMVTLVWPVSRPASAQSAAPGILSAEQLARRIVDEPWTVRVLDLRGPDACAQSKPIPGSECVNGDQLAGLGLQYASGRRDLVVVAADQNAILPAPAAKYPGQVMVLDGGYAAWQGYALTAPPAPNPAAAPAEREAHQFRAALYAALANQKLAPAAPAGATKYEPKKKKKGGGCN